MEDDGGCVAGDLQHLSAHPPLLALLVHWAEDSAIGAQLIDDFVSKPLTDVALPSDGEYRSRGILLSKHH
jgi:hypothetical protein